MTLALSDLPQAIPVLLVATGIGSVVNAFIFALYFSKLRPRCLKKSTPVRRATIAFSILFPICHIGVILIDERLWFMTLPGIFAMLLLPSSALLAIAIWLDTRSLAAASAPLAAAALVCGISALVAEKDGFAAFVTYGTMPLPWHVVCFFGLRLFATPAWNRQLELTGPQCPKCGYSRRGLSGAACPECGEPLSSIE